MDIQISELIEIVDRILAYVKSRHGGTFHLTVDYYWNVPKDQVYNPYQEPANLDLGQISDDWRELQRILRGESEELAYALTWISPILRALGEVTVS